MTEQRARYSFGVRTDSDWAPGSKYRGTARGGAITINEGENLEVDPPRRLVQSYRACGTTTSGPRARRA